MRARTHPRRSRVAEVETEVFDLMCNLGASDAQLEYETIFARSITRNALLGGARVVFYGGP